MKCHCYRNICFILETLAKIFVRNIGVILGKRKQLNVFAIFRVNTADIHQDIAITNNISLI